MLLEIFPKAPLLEIFILKERMRNSLTPTRCATVTASPIARALANPKSLRPLSSDVDEKTVNKRMTVRISSTKNACTESTPLAG